MDISSETQSLDLSLACDEAYMSLLCNSNSDLISDTTYADELQLQEAIMASLISSQNHHPKLPPLPSLTTGESSQSPCEICYDRKDGDEIFPMRNCTHHYCTNCISRYVSELVRRGTNAEEVGSELHQNVLQQSCSYSSKAVAPLLNCPNGDGCCGVIEIDACRGVIDAVVMEAWDDAACLSTISYEQRFYCPYRDCSRLLVIDEGGGEIREAECLFCRRLVCVRCSVPWHTGMDCEEYGALGEGEKGQEDLLVHELAKQRNWRRCPCCKFYIEKNEGCIHITCRCDFEFCYHCGTTWSASHTC